MSGWREYDRNHDGRVDQGEIDRWQLDNGSYPGQFENEGSEGCEPYSGDKSGCSKGCLFSVLGLIVLFAILTAIASYFV